MRRRDITLTIALCGSLVLHTLVCVAASERYAHHARIWLAGFSPDETMPESVVDVMQPAQDAKMRLGDPDGEGTAIDSSPGDRQLLAPHGFQDQPFLSTDPVGPGRIDHESSDATALPGEGGSFAAAPAPPMIAPAEPDLIGLAAAPAEMQPVLPQPPAPPLPTAPAATSGIPGPSEAADPAAMGDSDIDPTSMVVTLNLRNGSTVARSGRKHRLTPRPRFDVAAKADAYALRVSSLVLKLRIDANGNVNHVQVLKSSGSEALDQTCKVAAYEWWFEPLRDPAGNIIADEFPFVIVF
jgi:TonB family protein